MIDLFSSDQFENFVRQCIDEFRHQDGLYISVNLADISAIYDIWLEMASSHIAKADFKALDKGKIVQTHVVLSVISDQLGILCMLLSGGKSTVTLNGFSDNCPLEASEKYAFEECPSHFFASLLCAKILRIYFKAIIGTDIVKNVNFIPDIVSLCIQSSRSRKPSLMRKFYRNIIDSNHFKYF